MENFKKDSLRFIKTEGDKIFVTGQVGNNIIKKIIPDALALLQEHPEYNQIVLEDINSTTFTLDQGCTLEKAIELFESAWTDLMEKIDQKRKDYEETAEGQAEVKRIAEENAAQEAYRFKDFSELYSAINALPVTDLKSSKTSMKDAIDFCKELMVIFSKSDNLEISKNQLKSFNDLLKNKGACGYHDAASKFLPPFNKKMSIEETLESNGTIYFPLSALLQIIDKTSTDSVKFALSRMGNGGEKHSWCMQWVNAQKPLEAERSL